ncbi:MAG: hypothetical protein KC544_11660 [Gemmatimonadetes bacterium]|nr:hypothetical protein [Gemmatimonadota bacterium]MCB9504677.1 hypothetical protein [Gemmatimonadales bacterium]MCA9763774.1 hypothetical protein [Gemmatimonadota bacterium]MCA9767914.1 hypothetical protein [Gemmatimonadota bacterium]HPF61061.1 hypothetical protein [Gemmatimonadales bacterium]
MRRISLAATLLLVMTAACSDSPTTSGTPLGTALNEDIAAVAADGVAQDVDLMAGANGELGTVSFAGAALLDPPHGPGNVEGCGFGGGRWTCPRNRANGLDVTRSVEFLDGAGESMQAYDADLTATILVEVTIEGDVTRGPWSASTHRERDLVFTGLLGANTVRTVNGTGHEEISRARVGAGNSPERGYELTCDLTIVDVVVPVPGEGIDPWPLSGTITRTCTVTPRNGDPVVRTVLVTFDGTSTPDATVNGEPFEIDLAARQARRR